LSIHQVKGWGTIPNRLGTRIAAERPSGDDESLICPPNHSAPKIAHDAYTDGLSVPFALKDDLEIDQATKPQHPFPVNAPVTGSAGDFHLRKATFTEQGQELHLHGATVIKDQSILVPDPPRPL